MLCLAVGIEHVFATTVEDKGVYRPGGVASYNLYRSYDTYYGEIINEHYYALVIGIATQAAATIPEYITNVNDGKRYYVEGIGYERISAAVTFLTFNGDVKYWNHSIVVQGLQEIHFNKKFFDFQGQTSDYFEQSIGGITVYVKDTSPAQVVELRKRDVWKEFEDVIPEIPTYDYSLRQTSTGGTTEFYDMKGRTYVGTASLSDFTKLATLEGPGTASGSLNRWSNYAVVLNCDLAAKIPHLKRAGVEVTLEKNSQFAYYKEMDVQGACSYEAWYTDQLCEVTIQQQNRNGQYAYSYVLNDKPYAGVLAGEQCMILAPRGGTLTLELPADEQALTRYTIDGVEHVATPQDGKYTCEITLPKQEQSTIVFEWEYVAPAITLNFLCHGSGDNHTWLHWDGGVYEGHFYDGASQEIIPLDQLTEELKMLLDVQPGVTFKVYKDNNDITEQFANDYNPLEYYAALDKESATYTVIYEPSTIKNIQFADPNVKAICVENWDTNGDGELSYEEAAAVTTLRKDNGDGTFGASVFMGNTDITSFDELQYFTRLDTIPRDAFREDLALTSVVIPQSVASVNAFSFLDCANLKHVVLPDSLSWIDSGTFKNTAIQHITLPEKGSLMLGFNVFTNTPLKTLYIPANLTATIYPEVVSMCFDLISISVDEGNRNYDSREGCNAIIKTATNTLIAGCKNSVIPEGVKALGDKAFFYTDIKKVVLPASLESLGRTSFFRCDSLATVVAHMPEPFAISSANIQGLHPNCKLYVPKGKKDVYEAAGWTTTIFKGGIFEDNSNNGDVNGDGQVTIADVTKLVNIILGKE